jgi:hypothetical protein
MSGCELCVHYDLFLLLPTSTKHYKKKTNKSVKNSLAHLLTRVAMWPHNGTHANW